MVAFELAERASEKLEAKRVEKDDYDGNLHFNARREQKSERERDCWFGAGESVGNYLIIVLWPTGLIVGL